MSKQSDKNFYLNETAPDFRKRSSALGGSQAGLHTSNNHFHNFCMW